MILQLLKRKFVKKTVKDRPFLSINNSLELYYGGGFGNIEMYLAATMIACMVRSLLVGLWLWARHNEAATSVVPFFYSKKECFLLPLLKDKL
jgi:hypothetical protein